MIIYVFVYTYIYMHSTYRINTKTDILMQMWLPFASLEVAQLGLHRTDMTTDLWFSTG